MPSAHPAGAASSQGPRPADPRETGHPPLTKLRCPRRDAATDRRPTEEPSSRAHGAASPTPPRGLGLDPNRATRLPAAGVHATPDAGLRLSLSEADLEGCGEQLLLDEKRVELAAGNQHGK